MVSTPFAVKESARIQYVDPQSCFFISQALVIRTEHPDSDWPTDAVRLPTRELYGFTEDKGLSVRNRKRRAQSPLSCSPETISIDWLSYMVSDPQTRRGRAPLC